MLQYDAETVGVDRAFDVNACASEFDANDAIARLRADDFMDAYGHELRGYDVEAAFAIKLAPVEDLVGVDAVGSCDDCDGCSRLQRFFDNAASFLLRSTGAFRDWLVGHGFEHAEKEATLARRPSPDAYGLPAFRSDESGP